MTVGRSAEREGIEPDGRFRLIEGDLDRLEERITIGLDKANEKLQRILWAVVTLIFSVAATLVTFVITAR